MHNLAKSIRKGWARMGEDMCQFRFPLTKLNTLMKTTYLLKKIGFFCVNIFFFSIPTIHNLTFFFVFSDFLVKLSFSRKLCSSKKQLYYVITCKILWGWMQEYHLHWHGTYVKLLLIILALLCLFVFWTSLGVISC